MSIRGITVCAAVCLSMQLRAENGIHIFTDLKDRAVAATVIHFDSQRGLVELELENKRRTKVKPEVFVEKDRKYIRDWAIGNAFMSSSGLRFKGEKEVIEDWHEDLTGVNRDWEKIIYQCELKNGSPFTFENLEVEYCVYWEQEVAENNGERRDEKDQSGRISVGSVEPRAVSSFSTVPVSLLYQHLAAGYYYREGAPGKQSSKMKGVWVKVKLTTESGGTYVREFCEPAGVMKHQTWKAPSSEEGEQVSKKKKKKKKN